MRIRTSCQPSCEHSLDWRVRVLQPVSYISLALTLGTGGSLLWYYSHIRDKKLSGAAILFDTIPVPLHEGA